MKVRIVLPGVSRTWMVWSRDDNPQTEVPQDQVKLLLFIVSCFVPVVHSSNDNDREELTPIYKFMV